jgi:hypothetical protein
MEVHHPHHPTHKKKWSEYIIEFVMLFAAVTLGFFAENIREHLAENEKQRESMESVSTDFHKDIELIKFHKNFNAYRFNVCDSLNQLLKLPLDKIDQQQYYRLLLEFPHAWKFTSNNKSRLDAESKGYFSNNDQSELANAIYKYDYFMGELDEFLKTDLTSLSSFIDNKLNRYVNPDLLETASIFSNKNLPKKMGIDKISSTDINDLRVHLITKKTLIEYTNQLFDSLSLYANKSINIIEENKK